MAEGLGAQPVVSINGQRLEAKVIARLEIAVVETDLIAPSVVRLEFSDRDATLPDELGLELGHELDVRAAAVGASGTTQIFVGKVYAIEYAVDDRGGYTVIVGFDAGYVLRQTRATRSFNDVTDADVVNRVCQDLGIATGAVEGTDVTHPYIAQLNETNWDFLQRRAHANDRILFVEAGKVQFCKSQEAADGPAVGGRGSRDALQLSFGSNVTRLHARVSAAGQAGDIEVRGWDPVTKQTITSTAATATRSVDTNASPQEIGRELGATTHLVAHPALATSPECESLRDSIVQSVASGLLYVDGQAIGDPRLIAGNPVSLGVAGRFNGKYTISTARHMFDQQGYTTEFVLSGGADRTIVGLLADHRSHPGPGLFPAIVVDIADPEQRGRVRVGLPWLDDAFVSNWSRVSQVGAGNDRGIMWLPEVDDEVLVGFIDGDVSHPVIVGGLYNGQDVAPLQGFEDGDNHQVDVRCLRSRIGHTIELHDTEGEERIQITSGDGSIKVVLDQANGTIQISSDGDLEVSAGGAASLTAGGNFTIEAQGNLELKASGNAEINAAAGLKLAASGQVDVQGALINLN